ncbi:MAG: NAD-dependent deacylase [Silicimonas sp.]|nr:NAD-dependent deacylase [Silicimonas sp.]
MMKIVVLTGAGISAESGLGTFRDKGGVWTQHDFADVATPEGFARDPVKVHEFYNARRANAAKAEPNAAHFALARLQARFAGDVVLVTQNVDGLHEAAGAQVIHMHGALDRATCAACAARWAAPLVMNAEDPCPFCAATATRPDIVWFGEMPKALRQITAHLSAAELFVAIGTSGQVYPAAGFVEIAKTSGARTVEMNVEATGNGLFDHVELGVATQTVPVWVDRLFDRLA